MTICQTSSNPYNSSLYGQSKKLSECILNKYTEKTGIKKERVWETDTMSCINWCQVPVTILELGYMSNKIEDLKLSDDSFQNEMVEGIVLGINQYLNSLKKWEQIVVSYFFINCFFANRQYILNPL